MNYKIFLTVLILLPIGMFSQNEKSKADKLFYEYKYESAINEYAKERVKNQLTNHQLLNLADSYFNTGSYGNAAKFYVEVNKNDTIMSVNRFNKMLQSLSKSSDKERVETFLKSKTPLLSAELLENSEFNYSLLENMSKDSDFTIKNLSSNSPQGDISPAFYKDGLLFSSSRTQKSKNVYEPSGESYLDIYFGKLDANRDINNAEVFKRIPDSKFHQSTPFYSKELATFYYILSNSVDGELAFDENAKNALAIGSMKENGQFRFILKDLSTSFYYPFFDGKTERLFFAANFGDSYGGTDLYYVYTNNGQIMSAPVNLGSRVNSPGNEIAPYIFEGSLYFSSDVFYGLGGMDVYKANIIEDDSFTIPVNLGTGINSESDDFGFIITKSQDNKFEGYFASNRKGGKGGDDLYGFSTDDIPGLKTFALRGKVVNLTKNLGLDKARVMLLSSEGEIIKEAYSTENGDFRIEIPWRSQITIQITKEGYSIFSTSYSEKGMEELQISSYNIGLVKMEDLLTESENKTVLKLNKFYFEKGKAVINPEVATELDKVIVAVSKFPELRLKIETHTDSRGSSSSNKRLSQNRSDAIKSYLLKNGLSANTIVESIGYGEEMIRNNCTDGAYCLDFLHKQNERTLIVVAGE